MERIWIPATGPEDWRRQLPDAERDREWRPGRAAWELAHCWAEADGLPEGVRRTFAAAPALPDLDPLLVLPGRRVAIPGGAPVPTDAWVLARSGPELVSIAVAGTAGETPGPTVGEWLGEDVHGEREERLAALGELVALPGEPSPRTRALLLERLGAAVHEAGRFNALHAVLLVHAFGAPDGSFTDLAHLVEQFGLTAGPGELVTLGRPGIALHFAWVREEGGHLPR